jgi:hypothetical protein
MMLQHTLAGPFEPGSNVQRDVVSTSWVLLLHDLEIRLALVLGSPDSETLEVVSAIADVVCTSAGKERPDLVVVAEGAPPATADLVSGLLSHASVYWAENRFRPVGLQPSAWLVRAPRATGPPENVDGAIAVPFLTTSRGARTEAIKRVDRVVRRLLVRLATALGRGRSVRSTSRPRGEPDRAGSALTLTTDPQVDSRQRSALLLRQPSAEAGRLPRWIIEIAADAGIDVCGRPWTFNAEADYRSQKAMFFIGSELIVKVTRDARFSPRLENEHRTLEVLAAHAIPFTPLALFAGRHRGLAVVGETAVNGVPFSEGSDGTPGCGRLQAVLQWATELATNPTLIGAADLDDVAAATRRLVGAFASTCAPPETTQRLLEADADLVARHNLPTVFMHGDLATWNVLLTADGFGVLDWENADPRGAPLWDVAYLVLTHAMRSTTASGIRFTPSLALEQLRSEPWRRLLDEALERQRAILAIAPETVQPLVRLGWAHLAVKEATRLPPSRGHRGFYAGLLRLLSDHERT